MSDAANSDGYVLSREASEYERLKAQSAIWAPLTGRVLDAAGLGPGMNALDAGCGPGEVMRLMGRRVGPTGRVTGIDIDAGVGAYGLSRLEAEEEGVFAFHPADLTKDDPVPGAPFDLVYCRFLLIHMDDPVAMVRRLAGLVKPGGTLVAMDYVMDTIRVAPDNAVLSRGVAVMNGVFAAAGRPLDAGVRLAEWFVAAGLPMPHGTDIEGRLELIGGEEPMLARTLQALAGPAVALGVADAAEMAALPGQIRAVAARREHVFHWPTVTAAWTRVGG